MPLPSTSSDDAPAETHSVADGNARRLGEARGAASLGRGRANWYEHPGGTASGGRFDLDGLTVAHYTLPLGSRVRVVNEGDGRSVVVEITDRINQRTQAERPYVIDLSRGSARKLGIADIAQVALYRAE